MGVVVPEGEYVATFVFHVEGSTKDLTWSLGVVDLADPDPEDLAYDLNTKWGTDPGTGEVPFQADKLGNQYTFVGTSVMKMTGTGPLVGQYFGNIEGTDSQQPLPANCCLLFTKQTALGGRKYRGRAYVPPCLIGENGVDGAGIIGSGGAEQMTEYFTTALNLMVTDSQVPVLHHSDGSAGTPITAMVCSSTIATQRRRIR